MTQGGLKEGRKMTGRKKPPAVSNGVNPVALPVEYAMVALRRRRMGLVIAFLAVTFLLGAGFVALEISEFINSSVKTRDLTV
jgi:hypothetical protein